MDNSPMSKQHFSALVDKKSPNSALLPNCLRAFFIGGFVCVIGQFLTTFYKSIVTSPDTASTLTAITLIFLAALLTGFGVFDNIAQYAGAGVIVPITGFANSVAAPAIEFKKEGFIFGVGAKMFIIAGPVIVYGLATSTLIGIIYYIFNH